MRESSHNDISYLLSNRKHDAFIFMSWAMDFNALFWIMACLIQIKEIQYDRVQRCNRGVGVNQDKSAYSFSEYIDCLQKANNLGLDITVLGRFMSWI